MRAPPSGQLNAAITLRSPEAVASGKLVAPPQPSHEQRAYAREE